MRNACRLIKSTFLLTVFALSILLSSCSRPVYYSSARVYNARKEQNKTLKRKGYSNQQYKRSNKKSKKWGKKNTFQKKRYKQKSSKSGKK